MGSGAYGGTLAAPIWHDYMLAAQGTDCPDFPAPENPVESSTWTGTHTVSAPSATPSYGGTVKPSGGGNASGGGNGQYPSDLYAPGAGQGAAPSPQGGGGGGSGGGGGTGGEGAP